MKISEQLEAFLAVLGDWAKQYGGVAKVAGDKSQLIALLSQKPGAPRVAIVFISEVPRGEINPEDMDRVDREFWIIVSRGQGFKQDAGDSLTKGAGGGPPMFDLVEEARDVARGVQLDPATTERPVVYGGMESFDPEASQSDAYAIKVKIGTDIGGLTSDQAEQ